MSAAAWFTRRLEALCDRLELSVGALSILGALGANIPNYVASIDAIAHGSTEVGLGIIVGSNIYNVAIILGLATFSTNEKKGLRLSQGEASQVQDAGHYALIILIISLLVIWLLPQKFFWSSLYTSPLTGWILLIGILLDLGVFAGFAWHILHRPHPAHLIKHKQEANPATRLPLLRLFIETMLALVMALGGVVVMVQTGQDLTSRMHMAPVLAGLLVLAVATSLPNTVVAIILVRTEPAAACVEEIFSSNSVNAALGIAFPLLFWQQSTHDLLLLVLDAPFMVLLIIWTLFATQRGQFSRSAGLCLLLSYFVWVGVHVLV